LNIAVSLSHCKIQCNIYILLKEIQSYRRTKRPLITSLQNFRRHCLADTSCNLLSPSSRDREVLYGLTIRIVNLYMYILRYFIIIDTSKSIKRDDNDLVMITIIIIIVILSRAMRKISINSRCPSPIYHAGIPKSEKIAFKSLNSQFKFKL